MSSTDELTGLLNIQSFHEALEGVARTGAAYVLVEMDMDDNVWHVVKSTPRVAK